MMSVWEAQTNDVAVPIGVPDQKRSLCVVQVDMDKRHILFNLDALLL